MTLSDRQRAALLVLAERGGWHRSGYFRMRTNTLDSLVDKGLAERRMVYMTLNEEWRITDAGRELAASLE
jgi:hypothetical protein